MATQISSDVLINPQSLEVGVNGPDGANRLFVFTATAPMNLAANQGMIRKETFTWLLGPQLSRRQFIRAIADASISDSRISAAGAAIGLTTAWGYAIESADADWDDETQWVECRVEVSVSAGDVTAEVRQINYHVTVLAEVPV